MSCIHVFSDVGSESASDTKMNDERGGESLSSLGSGGASEIFKTAPNPFVCPFWPGHLSVEEINFQKKGESSSTEVPFICPFPLGQFSAEQINFQKKIRVLFK